MTNQAPESSVLLRRWAADLHREVVVELSASQVSTAAHVAAEASLFGLVATTSTLQGGTAMTTSTIGAAAATGLKAKIVAGSLAAVLTAGGAAAATGNLPDGAQSFTADVAGSIGLEIPRLETNVGLFARAEATADQFITVSTVGRVGIGVDASGLILTDITGNVGVTASIIAETGDAIIVEFFNATEVATVVVTRAGDEILSEVSRTAFGLDAETGVLVETPIGSIESSQSGTGSGSLNSNGGQPGGAAVVEGQSDTSFDLQAEQCMATDAAGDVGLGLSGTTDATFDLTGEVATDACVSSDIEAETETSSQAGGNG